MSETKGYSVGLDFVPSTGAPLGYEVGIEFVQGDGPPPGDLINASLFATFPDLTFSATIAPVFDASLVTGALPELTFIASVAYESRTERPTVSHAMSNWDVATAAEVGATTSAQLAVTMQSGPSVAWQRAGFTQSGIDALQPARLRPERVRRAHKHTRADRVATWPYRTHHEDALPTARQSRAVSYAEGIRISNVRGAWWQEMYRDRRNATEGFWQEGGAVSTPYGEVIVLAMPLDAVLGGRFQEAMPPPPGIRIKPPPEPEAPCYEPSANLVFADAWTDNTNLLFVCERHAPGPGPDPDPETIVVPVRRVYVVLNDCTLIRVDGNIELPTFGISLSIDAESWTWGFSARLPAQALADLEPAGDGTPVELEVIVNGTAYRVVCEKITRERVFGQAAIRISGRGRSALLDAPYAPVGTFNNEIARTAQQLMEDALTLNGVSLGWSLDFNLVDWLVPAGAWAHRGTYISALNAIANAAGGYIQPHASEQTLRVLSRYPAAPWEWVDLVPDYELPAAVTTREGIEWVEKPRYNRVYVSGVAQGVLCQVTRGGTAGDLIAPMVTDALITHADAGGQRGRVVLSDVGRQANVSLRVPVLQETGVILPGKFVRYVDGSTVRVGLVRSTNVDVAMPEVFQTIGVETHVAP